MTINILTDELEQSGLCRITAMHVVSDSLILEDIRIGDLHREPDKQNMLYVISGSGRAQNLIDEALYLFVETGSEPLKGPGQKNYITAAPLAPLPDLYDFLKGLFADDKKINTQLAPVIEMLIKNEGLQNISNAAERILKNPFWITDMNFKYLTVPVVSPKDIRVRQEIKQGYILTDTIAQYRINKYREKLNEARRALAFETDIPGQRVMVCAIKVNDITIGYTNMIEEGRRFESYDFRCMSRISKIISCEMQKNEFYKNNRNVMYSHFLTELLEGHIPAADIKARMEYINFSPAKYFHILAIDLYDTELKDILMDSIHGQIKYITGNSIYCVYKNCSVFLISADKPVSGSSRVFSGLSDFLADSNFYGALSEPFTDIADVTRAYNRTINTLKTARKLHPDVHLLKYSSVLLDYIISSLPEDISYDDFCFGAVRKLKENDRMYNLDYVNTLYVYLENLCNTGKTAAALSVHPNTLRYRLGKINEIMGFNLENGRQAAELFLSMLMYFSREEG